MLACEPWPWVVFSLPSATPSKQLWLDCHQCLDSFEHIVLSVDNDEAGNEAAARIAKLFPGKVLKKKKSAASYTWQA